MKPQNELLKYVSAAPNMVEVELLIAQVTDNYTSRFAQEVRKLKRDVESQENWIKSCLEHFRADIIRDKQALFAAIPEELKHTRMYKKLASSMAVQAREI